MTAELTVHPARPARRRRDGRRGRPVATFALWFVLLAALASVVPGLQEGLGLSMDALALIMLAPAVAAAFLLARPDWLPGRWAPAPWSRVTVSAGLAAVAVALPVGIALVAAGRVPPVPSVVGGVPLAVFVVLQVVGALGEEIGWRGLVQRCGEAYAPPLVVAVVQGALFGATHLGYWAAGPAVLVPFVLCTVVMSVTITLLWTGGFWQRMVPATLIHAGVNLGLWWLGPAGWQVLLVGNLAMLGVALLGHRLSARRGA